MKYKKRDPRSPQVIQEAIEMVRKMTPEEAKAFFAYRTPGIAETDMTGRYSDSESRRPAAHMKPSHANT